MRRGDRRAAPVAVARRTRAVIPGGPLGASLFMTAVWRVLVAVVGIWAHHSVLDLCLMHVPLLERSLSRLGGRDWALKIGRYRG